MALTVRVIDSQQRGIVVQKYREKNVIMTETVDLSMMIPSPIYQFRKQ